MEVGGRPHATGKGKSVAMPLRPPQIQILNDVGSNTGLRGCTPTILRNILVARHKRQIREWRYRSTHSLTRQQDGGEWPTSRHGKRVSDDPTDGQSATWEPQHTPPVSSLLWRPSEYRNATNGGFETISQLSDLCETRLEA